MDFPAIDIQNLSFSIEKKSILKSLSLQVETGEYMSIIGPNGAGKTSLLKCLMRIYSKYDGQISIYGNNTTGISQKELARQISYVPQRNGRMFQFTVKEFVLMGRYPYWSPFATLQKDDLQAVHDALNLTNTTTFAERKMDTLSGGEQQAVFIAAAVAQGAQIMLLDEPTTFLDPKHADEVYAILKRLNEEFGITVIAVTHDINNAVLHSDRILILREGAVLFSGIASQIMQNEILEAAYDKSFVFVEHPDTGQRLIVPEAA